MKSKVLVLILIALTVLCLFSCGENGKEEYCQAHFYNEDGVEIGCIDDLILGKDNKIHKSDIIHSMGASGNAPIASKKDILSAATLTVTVLSILMETEIRLPTL